MMTKLLSTQKHEICRSGEAPHIIEMGRIVGVVPVYVGTNPCGKPQRVSTLCEQYERKSTLCLWVHMRKKQNKTKRKERVCAAAQEEMKRRRRRERKGFAFFHIH
jgi:hypothetical protein